MQARHHPPHFASQPETAQGGDLFRALSNTSARKLLAWRCCGRNIAMDVARGLDFLHARNVIHVDVKSANVLLSREGQAKLTDVGLARITKDVSQSPHVENRTLRSQQGLQHLGDAPFQSA